MALALTVLVSHSFAMLGQPQPLFVETGGQVTLGYVAVLGFFGLSGWLLAMSRERASVLSFLRNRVLRILPAYWLALLLGGFVVAPIAVALVGDSLALDASTRYVVSNLTLVIPGEPGVPPAFAGGEINGSLWTLPVEVVCFLALAFVPVRWMRPMATGLVGAFLAVWAIVGGYEIQLILAFGAGALVHVWRLPVTIASSLVLVALAIVGYALQLTPVAGMAVAVGGLGLSRLPIRVDRDLSYGVYVFAFPIQAALSLTAVATLGIVPMIGASLALVLPVAWLSWTFVESRALRLRSDAPQRHHPAYWRQYSVRYGGSDHSSHWGRPADAPSSATNILAGTALKFLDRNPLGVWISTAIQGRS